LDAWDGGNGEPGRKRRFQSRMEEGLEAGHPIALLE
jgi:hypothetical protein